jgi:hypothetical protein
VWKLRFVLYLYIIYQNPITGFSQTTTFQKSSINSSNICFPVITDTTKRNVGFKDKKRQQIASYVNQEYVIDVDNITSLEKVYSTCIHSFQYIPQIFINKNVIIILASSIYSTEKHVINASIIVGLVTQYSKHLLQTGMIYYLYCYYLSIVIY